MKVRYGSKIYTRNFGRQSYSRVRNLFRRPEADSSTPSTSGTSAASPHRRVSSQSDVFGTESAVGEKRLIQGPPFLIVGEMQRRSRFSYRRTRPNKIYVPSTTMQVLTGQKYCNNFLFQRSPQLLEGRHRRKFGESLGPRLQFDPSDRRRVHWDTTENFHFFDCSFSRSTCSSSFGVLTLVVGGIGVSNIMNVVVDERTRESASKWPRARERFILRQFLLETML